MSVQLFPKMKHFFSLFLAALLMAGQLAVNAHTADNNKITDYIAQAVNIGTFNGTSWRA